MSIRSGKRIVIAAALGAFASSAVWANDLADCRRATQAKHYVQSCDRVLLNANATDKERVLAYRYRGDARAAAGAIVDAIADYTAALGIAPDNTLALAGRGRARIISGDLDAAIADYTSALAIASSQAWLYLERGHANLVRGDTNAAIADANSALALDPTNARAYNNRGLAYRKAGDPDQAHADYTRAIQHNPIYAVAYANRGYLEAARGRKAAAVADLQTALMLDSSLTGASTALRELGVKDDLGRESEQRVEAGKSLVEANCSACHAVGRVGDSPNRNAPEFRTLQSRHPLLALRAPLTRGIAAPHDQMPKFSLSDAEIDSIVAYINSLATAGNPAR